MCINLYLPKSLLSCIMFTIMSSHCFQSYIISHLSNIVILPTEPSISEKEHQTLQNISHHTSEEMTWKMYILSSIKGFSSVYCLNKFRAIFSLINDLVGFSISPGTTAWPSKKICIIYCTALDSALSQNTTLHLASSSSFSLLLSLFSKP